MKNEKVALIIIITIILVCVLGIIAICYNYSKDDVLENDEISNLKSGDTVVNENNTSMDEESENIIENNNQFQNSEKTVNKIDGSKPIVYDAINKEILGVDINLPYINIDSEDVRKINDDINELIQKYEKENVKDFIQFGGIEYFYVESEKLLSLITKHPNEATFYDVFNIDKYTGKKLSNLEVLTLYNIPSDKINLKEIYENVFIEKYVSKDLVDVFLTTGKLEENEFSEEIVLNLWNNREYWLPENNLENVQMYVDEIENIHIIVNLPALAGATDGIYQVDYKLINKNKEENNIDIKSENYQESNGEKISKKIDEAKDWVYSMLDTKNEEYIVRIPFINVESPKSKEINDELLGLANAVKEKLKNNDMGIHFYYSGYEMAFATDYEWYLNDNILSVVFRVEYEHQRHCNINFIENFDINTGENIDTKYILNYKGINEEEFKKELPKYYDNEFKIMYGYEIEEYTKEYYNKTIEDIPSNINEIPMYLDDRGNINMIIEIGALTEVSDKINVEVNDLENLNPYILKYSENWHVSRESLINLTDEQLNIAYNEIFARHGHDFKTQSLKEYFNSLSWYRPIEGKTVILEELSNNERSNLKTIKEEIDSRKNTYYLNLNKTSIDDLIAQNNINLLQLKEGNHELNLGKIKLGEIECDLAVAFNIYKSDNQLWYKDLKVILRNKEYLQSFSIEAGSTLDSNSFKEYIQMSTFNNKYFIINGFYGPDLLELNIFDENGLVFKEYGFNLEYNIEDGKILYSAHDEYAGPDVENAIGLFNYYKTYYEIIDENGKLKSKKVRVDYEDIYRSAQT